MIPAFLELHGQHGPHNTCGPNYNRAMCKSWMRKLLYLPLVKADTMSASILAVILAAKKNALSRIQRLT